VSVRRLLEFGSGESTRAFSALLPEVSITSVDQDAEHAAQFDRSRGEGTNVDLHIMPLVDRDVLGLRCRTFDFEPRGAFDVVLVDGPIGSTPNGRLGSMLLGYQALRPGGLLFLDDGARPDELRAVADFVERTGASFRFLPVGHGLFVFMRGEGELPPLSRSLRTRHLASFALRCGLRWWTSLPRRLARSLRVARKARGTV
jgi:SAM-dependent methyltransferase